MSTFSKSFASLGGFIAGDEPVVHYIKHHARSLIFSASIPAANAAAALAALRIMREEPQRVQRLSAIGERMRRELRAMGFNIGNTVSPIIPIIIGDRPCRKEPTCCVPATWPATPTSRSRACWMFTARWASRWG
jgi:7-keto-8-aminopelargonate synthetase-like enzyme